MRQNCILRAKYFFKSFFHALSVLPIISKNLIGFRIRIHIFFRFKSYGSYRIQTRHHVCITILSVLVSLPRNMYYRMFMSKSKYLPLTLTNLMTDCDVSVALT